MPRPIKLALGALTVLPFLALIVVLVRRAGTPLVELLLWTLLLIVFGVVTMPIYWYLFVWNDPEPTGRAGTRRRATTAPPPRARS